jgi:hypothetical protein
MISGGGGGDLRGLKVSYYCQSLRLGELVNFCSAKHHKQLVILSLNRQSYDGSTVKQQEFKRYSIITEAQRLRSSLK